LAMRRTPLSSSGIFVASTGLTPRSSTLPDSCANCWYTAMFHVGKYIAQVLMGLEPLFPQRPYGCAGTPTAGPEIQQLILSHAFLYPFQLFHEGLGLDPTDSP